MQTPNGNTPPKRARRVILTHLKAAAWSVLDQAHQRGHLPDRPVSTHASDGSTRVDIVLAREEHEAGDMPRLGPIDLERRIWEAVVAEKRRDPTRAVKALTIARLVSYPGRKVDAKLKYLLFFMCERGWLSLRHKQGYDLNLSNAPANG